MPWFRCNARGENFPFLVGADDDATWEVLGFHATRWVEADDPVSAKLAAFRVLRSEIPKPDNVPADIDLSKAEVVFEEIVEVEPPNDPPGEGFTFFPMDDEKSDE